MILALRKPRMSRREFFDWAEAQDARYEFDGFLPVAMTGGTLRHDRITKNIGIALDSRLRGECQPFGPNAGVRTVGDAVRYPDAVVTCSPFDPSARELPDPVVVIEVPGPTTDRVVKMMEYRAVPSIRRYVIVESTSAALTLYARADAGAEWTATVLTADKILPLPDIGIEIPVADFFANTDLATGAEEEAS